MLCTRSLLHCLIACRSLLQPKGRAMKRIKYNRRFVNVGELRHLLSWLTVHTFTFGGLLPCSSLKSAAIPAQ